MSYDEDCRHAGEFAETAVQEIEKLQRQHPGIHRVSWAVALIFSAAKAAQSTTLNEDSLADVLHKAMLTYPWKPRDVTPEVAAAVDRIVSMAKAQGSGA